jgi:membrane-bound lytic murein transglycosylase D
MLDMEWPFRVDYTEQVQEEITDYLRAGKRETERMLGRSVMYFPIFEHYIEAYDLPQELKYIPLLESRLRPAVESSAGAAGLWQFMPATGKGFGLSIDEWVDERKNPYQSTAAALQYLSQLYRQFDDWSLALAAYNCGPGRVSRILKNTGCDNFWDIEHLLPRQTRRYIPRIIATIYVAEQYAQHGLKPRFKQYQKQSFSVFRVHSAVDLAAIAQHCSMSQQQILRWNPGYHSLYAPAREKPYYLILPEHALPAFQNFIIKESRKTGDDYAIAVLESQSKNVVLRES